MADERFSVRRIGQQDNWRFLAMGYGKKWLNIAFSPDMVRTPRRVRNEIYQQMRAHFPEVQRLVPRPRLRRSHG